MGEYEEEDNGMRAKIKALCIAAYKVFVKGSPPEPCEEVVALFEQLCIPKRQQLMMYQVFHELKQNEDDEEIIRTAIAVKRESCFELILERRRWCEDLLRSLLQIGGCDEEDDEEEVSWDSFLYILLQFCSLSKVELCQALFLMILKKLESDKHHYITIDQLIDFYSFYAKCPVTSFNTRAIDFTRLPYRRYYVEDFTELVQRFTVLLNPTLHLQRSLQEFLPSVDFWDNHHRTEVVIRKITYDFFLMEKTRCFLWGEPPFRESCEMLAPEALGWEAYNKDQWDLRTFDLHERVGAISDAGSFSKCGKFVAPSGFQYRSLRQFSIWGEQPSPEDTEAMMLASQDDVYLSAAGYITKKVDKQEAEMEEKELTEAQKKEKKEKEKRKKESAALAMMPDDFDPVADPTTACLRGACIDETFNPPPQDMPPSWMKGAAIAPAPRILGPDPPLRKREVPGPNTQSAFWNSKTSFGMNQMNQTKDTWGEPAQPVGKSRGGGPTSPKSNRGAGGSQVKFSNV